MHVLLTAPSPPFPTGDAVSRKAIVDSLVLGCIPVLFHRGQAEQWPWHWGAWHQNASVRIDPDEVARRRLVPDCFPPLRTLLIVSLIRCSSIRPKWPEGASCLIASRL